ncbi:macrolide 2'-phosphotransferase [Georgenia sp. Z1491]|uniref:macrolide 2'-phosphotransferase n=1 Tax=Georgenia sp. Z1491 TaxID=3416707 RepID=UPI003CE75FBD
MTDDAQVPAGRDELAALAAAHGLDIDPASLRIEEVGLDYRVAIGSTAAGESWVLRVPRRPDVAEGIAAEAAILDVVRPRLSVAVPDWRIRSTRLVAYPLLPGSPGLTVDPATGEPVWHVDPTSRTYARAFGELLAELHGIDVDAAAAGGAVVETPDEVRTRRAGEVERVAGSFRVAPQLLERWRTWIGEDSFWPDRSVLTHGELYPAHVLVDEADRPTAVLDWTTAKVSDPGADLALHHATAGREAFAVTLEAYEDAGGRTWPRLADHCAEHMAASPVGYGIYALITGRPEHRAAAQELLDPA